MDGKIKNAYEELGIWEHVKEFVDEYGFITIYQIDFVNDLFKLGKRDIQYKGMAWRAEKLRELPYGN